MSQRMTAKSVASKQNNIHRQHECAEAKPERSLARHRIDKPHRLPHIMGKHEEKEKSEIEEVAMHILHNERKGTLAEVGAARLADGAGRWISPKSLIVGTTVIITGEAKTARRPEDEERRRKEKPRWPPKRLRAEPTVRRSAKKLRRIKWRKIGAEIIIFSLERRPGRINDESTQAEKNNQWLSPPHVGAHRLAKRTAWKSQFGLSHRGNLLVRSVR